MRPKIPTQDLCQSKKNILGKREYLALGGRLQENNEKEHLQLGKH